MTDHVQRLRELADRVVAAELRHTGPDAILLGGSAATGGADEHSDLDVLLYYETLPSDEAIAAARDELGGVDLKTIAPRSEEGVLEQFAVEGTEVQTGLVPIAALEADLRRVTQELDPDPLLMKMIGGLHDGVALHGADLIERWRAQARYGDDLQRAVVARHWRIVPLWRLQEHVAARDAFLWRQQILVDAAYDLLAVLAAANRVWFSSFQLKRTGALIDRLEAAPVDLRGRLESLFALEPGAAALELEQLVEETREILSARGLLP